MARPKTSYVCGTCGARTAQWQGQCPACEAWNSLELAIAAVGMAARASQRRSGPAGSDQQNSDGGLTRERRARRDRYRRTRSRARGRSRGRFGGAARRRSRHRQVDVAAAGGRCAEPRASRAVRVGRGIRPPGGLARRATRTGRDGIATRGGDARRVGARRGRRVARTGGRDRFDPDHADRVERIVGGFRGAGARVGGTPGALRQGIGHGRADHRSRDQGRPDRGPAHSRAHGRHGALFRKRSRQPLPRRARRQESLRRSQRTRRVRDGRAGTARSAQSVGDFPVASPGAGVGQRRHGRARRQPAAARRSAGAGRRCAGA